MTNNIFTILFTSIIQSFELYFFCRFSFFSIKQHVTFNHELIFIETSNTMSLLNKIKGGDLRSIGNAGLIIQEIGQDQNKFDEIFEGIFHHDPRIRMRSADIIEKVSKSYPRLLKTHKEQILRNLQNFKQQEVKWHIALILSYMELNTTEFESVVSKLKQWLSDPDESKIVRTNSMQALVDIAIRYNHSVSKIRSLIEKHLDNESPAIKSRARKLFKKIII